MEFGVEIVPLEGPAFYTLTSCSVRIAVIRRCVAVRKFVDCWRDRTPAAAPNLHTTYKQNETKTFWKSVKVVIPIIPDEIGMLLR